MLCWWLGLNAALQRWFGWEALPIVWTPVWADLTVAAVSILVAGIVRELMGLIRPHWIRTYLASGAILDVLVLPVLFRLLAADNYVAVAGGTGQSPMGIFAFMFNAMIFVGLILMTLMVVFDSVRDVGRLLHVSRIPFRASPGSRPIERRSNRLALNRSGEGHDQDLVARSREKSRSLISSCRRGGVRPELREAH